MNELSALWQSAPWLVAGGALVLINIEMCIRDRASSSLVRRMQLMGQCTIPASTSSKPGKIHFLSLIHI